MKFRNLVSLGIALSFMVLAFTGILSFFTDYSRVTATVHTFFGMAFLVMVLFHIRNNFKSLVSYFSVKMRSASPEFLVAGTAVVLLLIATYFQKAPFAGIMNLGARYKAQTAKTLNHDRYNFIEMDLSDEIVLQFDLLSGEHYWHPQIAVWVEDTTGRFIQTLFVTRATAKGLFFGGRTKDNFKSFDESKDWSSVDYRRVDALPVWSHKKGPAYPDGNFAPPSSNPLPDVITGATPIDNFILKTSIKPGSRFVLKLEINVAFDDNEYYSEYDFPDDEAYHAGTGLTGQPSLIFSTNIDLNDGVDYYLMTLDGHGHHSGKTGEIYTDLSKLTTALDIVERIVVGISSNELPPGN